MGGATAGYLSDCPALDGNRHIVSCRDVSSHFFSAFAKLLQDVVFITLVKLHTEDYRGCEIMQSQQSLILIETKLSFL